MIQKDDAVKNKLFITYSYCLNTKHTSNHTQVKPLSFIFFIFFILTFPVLKSCSKYTIKKIFLIMLSHACIPLGMNTYYPEFSWPGFQAAHWLEEGERTAHHAEKAGTHLSTVWFQRPPNKQKKTHTLTAKAHLSTDKISPNKMTTTFSQQR